MRMLLILRIRLPWHFRVLYILTMASLQRVHVRGHTYWRIVESHRAVESHVFPWLPTSARPMICSSGFRPPIPFASSQQY